MKTTKTGKILLVAGAAALTAVPYAASAESPFSDLNKSNSHYDSIVELHERGVISGYKDGTFKPNEKVTRGQAAKMLASILSLDLSKVKNPNFKDIPKTHNFYPYIAVLAKEGIISGFTDGTFRPNEPITRAQMAKIIVKGFKLQEAKELTHLFEDVTEKNANKYNIQTLVNLGITKGTSKVTFSPTKAVTRGQMASFLIRSENATVAKADVKEITKVETINGKTYIYLNGLRHTVNSNLKDILNADNTETLYGAHIEGNIVGTSIETLSKLTINASGSVGNTIAFDGKGFNLRGNLEITGDNVLISNLNVQGKIYIKKPQNKSFANVNKMIAAKSLSFIDWGDTKPPSEWGLGGNSSSQGNSGLVEIPENNIPVRPIMSIVENNITFVDVTMHQLIVEANRTKVTTNKEIKNLSIEKNVREFELHGNVKEMYVETDEDLTFYGVSDIEKLYKNSYKNLNLYADSITELLLIDNKFGWTDLGDFYTVNNVIIPENTQVYEVFNDFINDSDKIGNIKDPSGEEIDRDQIENTIIPDLEPPTLTIKDVKVNLANANITIHSNENGFVHYLVKREKDGEPSISEIMQYTGNMGGNKAVSENQDTVVTVENLKDQEKYIVYAVAIDEAGNVSKKKSEAFEVLDASPPKIDPANLIGLPGGKRLEVSMTPNEKGEYFYYYEPLPDMVSPKDYTSEEIIGLESMNYRGQTGKGKVNEAGKMTFEITGVEPLTQYAVYVVMKDEFGNLMEQPKVLVGSSTELDEVYPYITDGELHPINKDYYEFEINVNEALDPETANDVNNYDLSGTAILNISGQPTTIKPDSVTYVPGSKKIKIRIPSATALVNGDTIVVKILPGVKDLAGNEFVNLNVVESLDEVKNTASYVFSDTLMPELKINSFQLHPLKTSGILTYTANKAGTYYYMVVPNSYDMSNMLPRDFYNEFTEEPTLPNDKRIPFLTKQGDNGNNTVVVNKQEQNVILPEPSDPFESYSLYMIMKDRSGQLSTIEKVENVINDSRAPFIQSLSVTPKDGTDTSTEVKIKSSEMGTLFYTRLEKKVYDQQSGTMIDNPKIAEIKGWHEVLNGKKENHALINNELAKQYVNEIRSWNNTELSANELNQFEDKNLKAHTEYVYFFAAQDTFGNITMYSENTETTDKTDYNSNQMEVEVYTDGIAPTLGPIIKLIRNPELEKIKLGKTQNSGTFGDGNLTHLPGNTFVMTFSEAVKYAGTLSSSENDLTKLGEVIGSSMGVVIEDMEWEEKEGTHEPRKLVFTVQQKPTVDVFVTDLELVNFTDYNKPTGRAFDEQTNAKYLEPGPDLNTIAYAQLTGDNVKGPFENHLGEVRYESDSVILGMELNVRNDVEQSYYYVTQTKESGELRSFEDVVNLVENPLYGGYRGIGLVGTGAILKDVSGTTNNFSRSLEIYSDVGVFMSSQKLYLVTMDEYGNIVGVSGGSKFVPIVK